MIIYRALLMEAVTLMRGNVATLSRQPVKIRAIQSSSTGKGGRGEGKIVLLSSYDRHSTSHSSQPLG